MYMVGVVSAMHRRHTAVRFNPLAFPEVWLMCCLILKCLSSANTRVTTLNRSAYKDFLCNPPATCAVRAPG
jgi:hypothetical protein